MKSFDKSFRPAVGKVIGARSGHKAGGCELGINPKSGKPVSIKISRYGPVVQTGTADDDEKPRLSQLPASKSVEGVASEDTLELFRLPRTADQSGGTDMMIGAGHFGPYVLRQKRYVPLPKGENPLKVALGTAIQLTKQKRK